MKARITLLDIIGFVSLVACFLAIPWLLVGWAP